MDKENGGSESSAQIKNEVKVWSAVTPAETKTLVTSDGHEDRPSSPPPPPKMHLRRSSSATSCTTDDFSSSQQSSKVQCADIVLSCLFCRIYDLIYNLPDSCQSFINHCCPAVQHLSSAVEPADSDDGDSLMAMDCGVFTSCHDASDCLELAMEISEICYH